MSEKMKDSGVSWIGEIPEGWEVKPIKYVASYDDELITQSEISSDKRIRYVDIGSVNFSEGITNYQEMSLFNAPSRARKKVRVGDTIVSTVRTYLKAIAYIEEAKRVVVSTGFTVLRPKKIDGKYLNYAIKSDSFTNQVDRLSWGIAYPAINNSQLMNISIIYPTSLTKQKAIADYLDEKTSKFDQAQKLLKDEIERLRAYKKSLIYETVTKGLDKNVQLKDSGVDWIGEIPVGWEAKPIKYIFESVGSGTTPKSDREDFYNGGYNWIQSGDLYQIDEVIETSKTLTVQGQKSSTALKVYKAPFIAVAMYGASIGNLAISKIDAAVNQAVAVLKDKESRIRFGKYALQASKSELINAGIGGTQPNISQLLLKNWHLPQPSLNEQEKIANYLDKKTNKVDQIIKIKEQQLRNISEQRKTLIYEVVTGKK